MYPLVGLAGIGLRILTSHDSEALTECVHLRVEYDRLCAGNRNEVFFKLGMLYLIGDGDGDWGGRRTGFVCSKFSYEE